MHRVEEVIKANVDVHTAAVDKYLNEPHYRPENRDRVRSIIQSLQQRTRGEKLLDVGCGMGFIIDIAKEFFTIIRGVDVTPAMLERVNLEGRAIDVRVELSPVERLPYDDNFFDVCTAHALLHHLLDPVPALREIYRVLKPGGMFYSDLDPNGYFWEALTSLNPSRITNEVVLREIHGVKDKDQDIAEEFHLSVDTVQKAEYLKHVLGGFKEEYLMQALRETGFAEAEVKYQWFLGEAQVIHGENSKDSAQALRAYLQEVLPLTRHLFKYIMIFAQK
jgi:ubiquinone/menaquinone biosynthesis C-methylase UbiE